jgi:hypothetical protein
MPTVAKADRRSTTPGMTVRRIVCMVLLGAALAGCDRCGDLLSSMAGESQVCRQQAPRPQ